VRRVSDVIERRIQRIRCQCQISQKCWELQRREGEGQDNIAVVES
jgi:hypothetical protein